MSFYPLNEAGVATMPISSADFTPSGYQQAVFDFVTGGRGDGIVNAVAGSGKTTTLVQAARLIKSSSALFVAFNKHIAEELNTRLRGTPMTAKTVHSIGYGCLARTITGKLRVDDSKYRKLCMAWVDDASREWRGDDVPTLSAATQDLQQLCRMAQLTLTPPTPEALATIALAYGLDYHPLVLGGVAWVLRQGERLAKERGEIDYNDMLHLPHVWSLQPPTVAWLMADEVQDFNAAQLALVLKCRAPGGRMLFVGDPLQSIFGFAYAGVDSFDQIKQATQAVEMPLSICYRCPATHVALAQRLVPHIEARPDAPAGDIETVTEAQLPALVREGDLVLCRLTAPLITLCIQLIAQRVPARVRGRDIAKQLTGMVADIAKLDGFTYDDVHTFLHHYRDLHLLRLARKDASETAIQSLHDRCDGLQACIDGFPEAQDVDDLCRSIEGLFADDRASVWLSTIHRAKGLENDRVFILKPDKMPLTWPKQQPWERQQERNLEYVAYTRAKQALFFVVEKAAAVEAAQEVLSV